MSRIEAENTAWQRVIIAGDQRHPVPVYSIARTTGLSHDKILAMAGRYHVMTRAGIEPTGDWWHDRVTVKLPQGHRPDDRLADAPTTPVTATPISNSSAV